MPGNWQHRILHYDIPVPQDVWNKIADQLEEEYKVGDIMISQKLADFEITPPPFLLVNVLSAINTEQSVPRLKIFTLPVRRLVAAVVAIGLIAITMMYVLKPEPSPSAKNETAKITPSQPDIQAVTPSSTDKTKKVNQNQISPTVEVASLTSGPVKKVVPSEYRSSKKGRNVKHVSLNPVLAASAINPISVTAPPIYDNNGNIIMDESLVSAPDENYIIVTSPNGEQTKISRKFLKMLTVLNGGNTNNYMNAENFQWKIRFEEWRSKLLQQASYIPTANNFLDIMDLKEMLQEN